MFVVKYRRAVITERVRATISESFHDTAERLESEIQAVDGEADHIHLLTRYPPKIALSRLAGALKTNSARAVRDRGFAEVRRCLWGKHFWTDAYFAASTGGANLETVKAYIESQRKGQ